MCVWVDISVRKFKMWIDGSMFQWQALNNMKPTCWIHILSSIEKHPQFEKISKEMLIFTLRYIQSTVSTSLECLSPWREYIANKQRSQYRIAHICSFNQFTT